MATFPKPTPEQIAENQGPGIIAACLTVAVLATVAVVLRFLARTFQKVKIGVDDYLILLALVRTSSLGSDLRAKSFPKPFGWAMCACTIVGTTSSSTMAIKNLC